MQDVSRQLVTLLACLPARTTSSKVEPLVYTPTKENAKYLRPKLWQKLFANCMKGLDKAP